MALCDISQVAFCNPVVKSFESASEHLFAWFRGARDGLTGHMQRRYSDQGVDRQLGSSKFVCGVRLRSIWNMFAFRTSSAIGVLALASFIFAAPAANGAPGGGTCSVEDPNDIEYLVLWGLVPASQPDTVRGIDRFAAKIGTRGDGRTRQLGFGALIPVWLKNEQDIVQLIREAFYIAKQTDVAVHFNVDDHIAWEQRPDLWNWYDPARPGYNPDNKNNVEWYDWEGTPNKRRYLTPVGSPSQSPHMCYNSPIVRQEIIRIVSRIVGPALQEEIGKLRQENKEYLFAGITVGQELDFDDYSSVPLLSQAPPIPSHANPLQTQGRKTLLEAATLMEEDHAPHVRLGYCSLTNAGYSRNHSPSDVTKALADVIQTFIEFWDQQFVEAGIPCSRIYTHVPAPLPQDGKNVAPIPVVFNRYARAGWTTYPIDTLAKGFQPLYDELAKHGDPDWGGVEANAILANPDAAIKPSWETYLAWHYNHGAKLVGINNGASDESLMVYLSNSAFGDEAIAAYRKFLEGRELIEK